jgi:hypothetical protein
MLVTKVESWDNLWFTPFLRTPRRGVNLVHLWWRGGLGVRKKVLPAKLYPLSTSPPSVDQVEGGTTRWAGGKAVHVVFPACTHCPPIPPVLYPPCASFAGNTLSQLSYPFHLVHHRWRGVTHFPVPACPLRLPPSGVRELG